MAVDWGSATAGAIIGAVVSFPLGLLINSTSDLLRLWNARRRNPLQISSPQPGEILRDPKQFSPGKCFRVSGRLGFLPSGHKVWLLAQPHGQRGYWPQGFEAVSYTPATGDWFGYVFEPRGHAKITIFAVVAPPSAQAFFEYYQKHGDATNWAPLNEIPVECLNRQEVEAQTP